MTGDEDEEAAEPPPVALWFPLEYALDTWNDHEKHGSYPAVGGYNAQSPALLEDWRRLNQRYNFWFDQLLQEQQADKEMERLIGDGPESGRDWSDTLE